MRRAMVGTWMASALGVAVPGAVAAPEVIAHRGASAVAPENTLAAFREAWAQGADGIELDIGMTVDGKIVVMHDEDTRRTTGVKRVVAKTSVEEIQNLDAGRWKDVRWAGERVPTLEEVLATMPEGKTLFIEIKSGAELLPELARVIRGSGRPVEKIFLIAFDAETLVRAKEVVPEVRRLWVVGGTKNVVKRRMDYPDLEKLVEGALRAGIGGLDLNEGFPLDADHVAKLKQKGLMVAVWTVNDPVRAKALAAAGVDAITTDRPAEIRAALRE